MSNQSWVFCPICNNKTRTKIRNDTELINFPLFCPKCKQETIINMKRGNIIIREPDAKTQSRYVITSLHFTVPVHKSTGIEKRICEFVSSYLHF